MCSGRVDPGFVVRALQDGMDGVFIGACRLDECNYTTQGNYHALNMVLLMRRIMAWMGLNPARLRIDFMSAGDGNIFAEVMNDFSRQVHGFGPLGAAEGVDPDTLNARLDRVARLVPYLKLAAGEKLGRRLHDPSEYDGLFSAAEVEDLIVGAPSYWIDPEKCQACMRCLNRCPVEAIGGGKGRIHVIDQEKCIRCGSCLEACPPKFGAVTKLVGAPVPPSIAEEARTIVRKKRPEAEQ